MNSTSLFGWLHTVIGLSIFAAAAIAAYSIANAPEATNKVICCAVWNDYQVDPAKASQQYNFPTFDEWKNSSAVQSITEDCESINYPAQCPAILTAARL